ncbi:hypothetical protein D3C75_1067920 [compost metagenome]
MEESIRSPMTIRKETLIYTSSSGRVSIPPLARSIISMPGGEMFTKRLKMVDMEVAEEPIIWFMASCTALI